MIIFAMPPIISGCGSDEVISVSDLGKNSETTTADASDGTGSGTSAVSEGGNSSDGSEADNSGSDENGTADSATDTAELIGTWDESAHTYTNTVLNIELTLTEDWTADTSTEGGTILSYSRGGMTATAEFVFDIGGAYEDADAAWDAYYEYAGLDEDTLLLLAASAYVSYGTDAIGGKDFGTLNVIYEADGIETYQYVAIGETEGCMAVLMLDIDAELAAFESEEAAQNAMQEIVETVQVW
ncbi:MAG: hypothetical protein LUE29_10825 [Lachnospiraceae bacterium]|nr:hypothetical protein [Lachnospiraceae bacterium]